MHKKKCFSIFNTVPTFGFVLSILRGALETPTLSGVRQELPSLTGKKEIKQMTTKKTFER